MNKIYKKMKSRDFFTRIVAGVALIAIGALILYGTCEHLFGWITAKDQIFKESKEYIEYDVDSLEVGKYYKFENRLLIDYYASDEKGYYYFTPIKTKEGVQTYMGFCIPKSEFEKAEDIAKQTWNTYDTGVFPDKSFEGFGYVKSMEPEEEKYIKQFFQESNASQEVIDAIVLKTFVVVTSEEIFDISNIFGYLFCIGFVLVGLYLVVSFFIGGSKRGFKKLLKRMNISEIDLERDMEFSTGLFKNRVWMGERYAIFVGFTTKIIAYDKTVWAYTRITTTKHTMYGVIPTGTTKSYDVNFVDQTRGTIKYNVNKEEICTAILEVIQRKAPHVIVGYSDELQQMYLSNFSEMVNTVEQRKIQSQMNMAYDNMSNYNTY